MEQKQKVKLDTDEFKQIDFDTKSMFMGRKTLVIEHRGEAYYLRVTRNDKLILTK
jgi:hemin uptake protein HemP